MKPLIALLALILVPAAYWWTGPFGVLYILLLLGVAFLRLLKKNDLLNLPRQVEETMSLVSFVALVALVGTGAYTRYARYAEHRVKAEKAAAEEVTTVVPPYTTAQEAILLVGPNTLALAGAGTEGDRTPCLLAPKGFYFVEAHDGLYKKQIEVRVECSGGRRGTPSTHHSAFRPRSIYIRNHGRETAVVTVWIKPD